MKMYPIEEIRCGFEDGFVLRHDLRRDENGDYVEPRVDLAWSEWVRCARFLGALKEIGK